MNTIDFNPNLFLRQWLAHAIGIWPVAAVASLVAWTPIAIVLSLLGQFESLTFIINGISTLAFFTIPGAVIGYVIGDFQQTLMRQHLHWDVSEWVKFSVFGGFIGGMLVILMMLLFGTQVSEQVQLILALPLYILPLSVAQWWTIRRDALEAWMWILGNVVGAIVFSGLFFINQPLPLTDAQPINMIIMWLIAASALGIITGIVMLWLYERPLAEHDNENELAPVYVEVRHRDER